MVIVYAIRVLYTFIESGGVRYSIDYHYPLNKRGMMWKENYADRDVCMCQCVCVCARAKVAVAFFVFSCESARWVIDEMG